MANQVCWVFCHILLKPCNISPGCPLAKKENLSYWQQISISVMYPTSWYCSSGGMLYSTTTTHTLTNCILCSKCLIHFFKVLCGQLKDFSLNNEGKSFYLHLVQGRHDGLVLSGVPVHPRKFDIHTSLISYLFTSVL